MYKMMNVHDTSKVYVDEVILNGLRKKVKVNICFCYLPFFNDYQQAKRYLHPKETEYFDTLKFEKRKKSYLLGRFCAKKAISAAVDETILKNIAIEQGVFNQPIVTCVYKPHVQVSITHCDNVGAAIAFSENIPMGIDIERVDTNRRRVLEEQITQEEKRLISDLPYSYDEILTFMWTAKESISKVLKTGLTTPFHLFEIHKIESDKQQIISEFKNFVQYYTVSFKLSNYLCSITYPKNTQLNMNIETLKRRFENMVEQEDYLQNI
jgi:4'-phosphopantetheinyl transferase EntD